MSETSEAGGGNARNEDGGSTVTEAYEPDSDNNTVEYVVLDQSFKSEIPDSHTETKPNRYKGPKGDTAWQQLAGTGAIEITNDGNHNETEPVEIDGFRDDGKSAWIDEEISDDWDYIRTLYDSEESDDKARKQAVDDLAGTQHNYGDGDFEIVALSDSDELYCYNPTTGIYEPNGEAIVGKTLDKTLGDNYSIHEKREIVERLRDRHGIKRDTLGGPDSHVCVENGVLDLSDASNPTLRGHDSRYGFTTRLDVSYQPEAACPKFKQFLGEVCRPEDLTKLQEYAGYCLHTWGQPYKKALVILGPTDAGKGVFLRILREIIGKENVATETLKTINSTRWGTAKLYGKVVNIANELAEEGLDNAETFKTVTGGGDQITAERKGQDKFTFTPLAKHVFATNQVPDVENADEAFYNRWLFVTFPNTVPPAEQKEDLDEQIVSEEAAGILNWMLEGYARLQEQGRFSSERYLSDKQDIWSDYGDSIDRFVSECLEVTGDSDDQLAKKDAHNAFLAFCDDVGLAKKQQRQLTKRLTQESSVTTGQSRTVDAKTTDANRPQVVRGVALTEAGSPYLDACIADSDDNSTRRDSDVTEYDES